MAHLTTTELAERLKLSKARISQYVSEGKLAGCYSGDGRQRRFDLSKVSDALKRNLDLGQMTGNGRVTRRVLQGLDDADPVQPVPVRDGAELSSRDPDRLELATIQIKEEEARRRRRDNERDDGRWVMAEEVERNTARAIAREVSQFEVVLRDGARAVADTMGVDFRQVRKVLMDQWRQHRTARHEAVQADAEAASMTDAERASNV